MAASGARTYKVRAAEAVAGASPGAAAEDPRSGGMHMNRRLIWTGVAAVVAMAVALPALAQERQAPPRDRQGALAEHKAQEARDNAEADERAKRREAARSGTDPRNKARPAREEEEEKARERR